MPTSGGKRTALAIASSAVIACAFVVGACTSGGTIEQSPGPDASGLDTSLPSPSLDGATGANDSSIPRADARADADDAGPMDATDATSSSDGADAAESDAADAADAFMPDANDASDDAGDSSEDATDSGDDSSDSSFSDANDAGDDASAVFFDGATCPATTVPGCPTKPNLLRNPSFEAVPDAGGTGENLMPLDWIDLNPESDTYSNDGSYGLDPTANGLGDFTGVTAKDGIRWVVSWSATTGQIGQQLTTPLTPGAVYRLESWMHVAIRSDLANPGTYLVGLWDAAHQQPIEWVGVSCDIAGNDWGARSFTFVAPADAATRPILVLQSQAAAPSAGSSYAGLDLVSLTDVTTCP
jgi:hypothetical protein